MQLALALRPGGIVVGIDLSGDPTRGEWTTWEPALAAARAGGLPLTLHCGEVDNEDEVSPSREMHMSVVARRHLTHCPVFKVRAMLSFRPERLGHAVSAAADAGLLPALLASKTPVELCLTSNVLSHSVASYGCERTRGVAHTRMHVC